MKLSRPAGPVQAMAVRIQIERPKHTKDGPYLQQRLAGRRSASRWVPDRMEC
jgi:hypothetical protein